MSDFVERKFGDLTVRIDRTRCIASTNCINVAGEVFELDDEGIISFRDDSEPIVRDLLVEGCAACPVDALIVIDGDRRIVPE